MKYSNYPDAEHTARKGRQSSSQKSKRPQCLVCKEKFDTLLFAVTVKNGKAHPVCAALKMIGLEKLATTSGR